MRGLTYAAGEILVFMLAATLVGYMLGRFRARSRVLDRESAKESQPFELAPFAWAQIVDIDVPPDPAVDDAAVDADSVSPVPSPVAALPDGAEDETPGVPPADRVEEVAALVSEVDRQKDMIERLERVVEETEGTAANLVEREARIVDLEAALSVFGDDAPAMPFYTSTSSGSGVYTDLGIDFEVRV